MIFAKTLSDLDVNLTGLGYILMNIKCCYIHTRRKLATNLQPIWCKKNVIWEYGHQEKHVN